MIVVPVVAPVDDETPVLLDLVSLVLDAVYTRILRFTLDKNVTDIDK